MTGKTEFWRRRGIIALAMILTLGTSSLAVGQAKEYPAISMRPFGDSMRHWYGIHDDSNIVNPKKNQPRYKETQITKIADNILLYQRDNGGWPKNYDMQAILTPEQKQRLKDTKGHLHTTFDNSTTYTQVDYLAKVYTITHIEKYKEGCVKGINFILDAQFENGGWPQYYPLENKYSRHITFNDGAYMGIIHTLKKIIDNDPSYAFISDDLRAKVKKSYNKGLECILDTQIKDDGKLTAWCQQHDEVTLKPAWARAFEPPSICNGESVPIVLMLMNIDHPGQRVIDAIQGAVKWFRDSEIQHTRVKTIKAPPLKSKWRTSTTDKVVVNDPAAPPIWTRYYELKTERPLFCDRNSKFLYQLSDVSRERRSGYGWYTYAPQRVLDAYPEWQKKWAPNNNVLKDK